MELVKYPITSIPSGGIAYPENWEIEIEPYQFGQSSGIASTSLTQLRFYKLIMAGIHCNFNKESLLLQDIIFLGLARKLVSSESNDVVLRSRCSECLNVNKTKMSLVDAIQFENSKISNRSKYPVEVHFSEYTGWFRHLTYKEYIELAADENVTESTRLAKQTVKLVKNSEIDNDDYVATYEEDYVGPDKKNKFENLIKIYNKFRDNDAEILTKLIEIFNSSKIKSVSISCDNPECNATYTYDINEEDLSSILTPFRADKTNTVEDAIIL